NDVELRGVDVETDEVDLRADDLQLIGGEFRRVLAGVVEIAVRVSPFQDHAEDAGIQFAEGDLGGANMLRGVDRGYAGGDVLRNAHACAGACVGADRLHGEPVAQHD